MKRKLGDYELELNVLRITLNDIGWFAVQFFDVGLYNGKTQEWLLFSALLGVEGDLGGQSFAVEVLFNRFRWWKFFHKLPWHFEFKPIWYIAKKKDNWEITANHYYV